MQRYALAAGTNPPRPRLRLAHYAMLGASSCAWLRWRRTGGYADSQFKPWTMPDLKKIPQPLADEGIYFGGSSQTRTGDTRLFRPLLYQLS
jgi:hypothetical protein